MIWERLANYSNLIRLDRPIGTLLLLWPSFWALWIAAKGTPPLADGGYLYPGGGPDALCRLRHK